MQRKRPTPDLQFVLRPESDTTYRHFEGHETVPFDAGATRVTRAHAWWLAEAALLTYWDRGEAVARFASAGLEATPIVGGDTQLYVAHSATAVLVVFRGTESDRFGDLFDNAQFGLDRWRHGPGSVHAGFQRALQRVWEDLDRMLSTLGASRTVWFGGHSLGAALATLAAARYEATAGVSTIASPRVGDRLFAAAFDDRFADRSLRYENDTDIVTHIPPALRPPFTPSYEHVGQRRHIMPDGRITMQAPLLAHFVRDVFGNIEHLREVVEALRTGVMRRAPDFLLDHMPRGYAVDLWNDHDAHGA